MPINRRPPLGKTRRPSRPSRPALPRKPEDQVAEPGGSIKTRWTGFRPLFDFWGNQIKRFYQLETLASATDWMLKTDRDRFIVPSVNAVLGNLPIVSLTFEFFQEGRYQLIFRMRAVNIQSKEAVFAFVVAKRENDFSALAIGEHQNLATLYEREPDFVVRPFLGGKIFLPDRHGRPEHGRDVYAYLTQWLDGFHELGINENHQFIVNIAERRTLTIDQTEALKAGMIEVVARSYHAGRRDCMDLPEIASGDFVVTYPKRSTTIPKMKLIACRKMVHNTTPAKIINSLAATSWDWGGRKFYLAPIDPDQFCDAIENARGKEETARWFRLYLDAIRAKRCRPQKTLPVEDIQAWMNRTT